MITYNQYQINTAYNQLISNLVLWQYLTNKVKAETEQGYKVVKNKEKLDKITSNILDTLPAFDGIDISNIRLYMPLVDDMNLLEQFKEVEL
ncbi:hypothetical protein HMP0015_0076 [Acinetobacter haemolyticus ATCC 19194]|uniref:Uncharacterized protein n=1 Tax=Acinetobacter haemolyticus ATCC 19194 TaxID=707232 RepID=D4XK34_ACIHA|nr:hypothetical protein [Acinetobacter haemolyticus]EFF84447.1 hypothetical protein HMP0015_0076 [Acinetobacter haemolyticus ATCC 19194]